MCSICLDTLVIDKDTTILRCGHTFHNNAMIPGVLGLIIIYPALTVGILIEKIFIYKPSTF